MFQPITTPRRAALCLLALLGVARAQPAAPRFEVILRGGTVHDGTGAAARVTDLGFAGDRIVAVGDLRAATAPRELDCRGLIVAPGFIDAHSHAGDSDLIQADKAGVVPLLAQGLTTVVINADGWGIADLAAQRALIEKARPAVNAAPLIGHRPVRTAILGMSDRVPSPRELDAMAQLVRTAFARDGAFGLSTGLIYSPADFAQTAELTALARIAGEFGGFYHSHIRDESDLGPGLLGSIAELISIARDARVPGIVTHIKAVGPGAWGKSREAIRMIEAARAEGLAIWADQYPYEASTTFLSAMVLPPWAKADGGPQLRARLADPATRARIRAEAEDRLRRRGGAGVFLITEFEPERRFENRRLDDIARELGVDPAEAALALLARSEPRAIVFSMQDPDIVAFMQQPWTMTGSDGGGVAEFHPRSWGTFTRKLQHFALERGVITLERALHSMSGQVADVFGIPDRGKLRPGAFADVVVFDPACLRERSTYAAPRALSEGMIHVFVNGRPALAAGHPTAERAGRVLSRPRPAR
jgi:N-acyl-D-amino-acid deacylase